MNDDALEFAQTLLHRKCMGIFEVAYLPAGGSY